MQKELAELKVRLRRAEAVLDMTPPREPAEPSAEELASGADFVFQQHEARYLRAVEEEPARVVGWLMAKLNGERAVFMQDADAEVPILGTVDDSQVQRLMRVIADDQTVALVDLPMENQIGELFPAQELVTLLRESNLPVWKHLLQA